MVQIVWKTLAQFLTQLKIHLANYSAIPLLGFTQEKPEHMSKRELCVNSTSLLEANFKARLREWGTSQHPTFLHGV